MITLVVTTINPPTPAVQQLAKGCKKNKWNFIIIGDESSPRSFALNGVNYYSLQDQNGLEYLRLSSSLPTRHYSRKNLGYLLAIEFGSTIIVETDDDNWPLPNFWFKSITPVISKKAEKGWINVYRYFDEDKAWPRGFLLSSINKIQKPYRKLEDYVATSASCWIQQGLVDGDPDVDAVYRLSSPPLIKFKKFSTIVLGKKSWCPFNSQNTRWYPEAYPLLYLPSTCNNRVTDIWRSFIAQRILWENGVSVLFHFSTVLQKRNAHNLWTDFQHELVNYLNVERITNGLEKLILKPGISFIPDNMLLCYQYLVVQGFLESQELERLQAWLNDVKELTDEKDSGNA